MQRTIKFRAWNGKHISFPTSGAWFKLIKGVPEVPSGYELMQFTGLLDKNGKEIYESDIIEIDGSPVEVEWYAGAWTVQYFTTPTRSYLSQFDESDIEIIGNVFENPNLLTTTHTEKDI